MKAKSLLIRFLYVTIGGIIFSIFCLIANGSGDSPESFRMYLLCSSIVLGSVLLSLALLEKKEKPQED